MRATPLYWVIRSRLTSITIINTKNRSGVARRKKPVIPSLEELEEKESDKHDESLCNPFSRTFPSICIRFLIVGLKKPLKRVR
jgi:hypothetical protein